MYVIPAGLRSNKSLSTHLLRHLRPVIEALGGNGKLEGAQLGS